MHEAIEVTTTTALAAAKLPGFYLVVTEQRGMHTIAMQRLAAQLRRIAKRAGHDVHINTTGSGSLLMHVKAVTR